MLLEGKDGISRLSVSQCPALGLAHRRDLTRVGRKKEGRREERREGGEEGEVIRMQAELK